MNISLKRFAFAGQIPDAATGSRAAPIYQTAAYVFDDTDHAAVSLFNKLLGIFTVAYPIQQP